MRSDDEPLSKKSKRVADPLASRPPLSSVQLKLKEASNGEKRLIIKHPSLSKATEFTLDSAVGSLMIHCGDLRVQISEYEYCERLHDQQASPVTTEESDRSAGEGSMSPPQRPASVSPAPTAEAQQRYIPALITVRLESDRWDDFEATFDRHARVEDVLQQFADASGQSEETLSVYYGFKKIPLPRHKRLGTFVPRTTTMLHLRVVDDGDDTSDEYSLYGSESEDHA